MRITAVDTHVCHARMRNWVFVRVRTDQDGLWGWGEATLEWHTRAVVGAVEDLTPLLLGEDPTRIEHLWQLMHRGHFWHGTGIVRAWQSTMMSTSSPTASRMAATQRSASRSGARPSIGIVAGTAMALKAVKPDSTMACARSAKSCSSPGS